MTDEVLRSRTEGGDVPARTALLRAKLRAGALELNQLRMAAALDPAAEHALGDATPLPLSEWPEEAGLRLALAASWVAFPAYEEENQTITGNDSPLLRALLRALDMHTLGRGSADALLQALLGAMGDWAATSFELVHEPEEWAWLQAVRSAAWALRAHPAFQSSEAAYRSQDDWGLGMEWGLDPAEAVMLVRRALEGEDPLPRIAAEVVPWLLGEGDPVAERAGA